MTNPTQPADPVTPPSPQPPGPQPDKRIDPGQPSTTPGPEIPLHEDKTPDEVPAPRHAPGSPRRETA